MDKKNESFRRKAEPIMNRALKELKSLEELSYKHSYSDEDVNKMLNALKKQVEAIRKIYQENKDGSDGFKF